jgi:polyhydroxyalkanoate synthesis regulator phasin
MAFESVRSYIQLASGLGEMTRARAMEAAQGLLSLPGADEVTRRAVRASTLADQLLEAAKANRANLLALVQHEVESALKRADVARVADVRAAQVTVSALAKEIADLRGMLRAGGDAAGRRSGAVSTTVRADSPAAEAVTTSPTATSPTATRRAPTKKAPARKTTARKATARKATARKATAKGTAATRATATRPAAKKAAATRATAKKTTATKATATRKAAAKKTTATKATAKKATATKATAKKANP